MNQSQRLHIIGMVWALFIVVSGELIWLFDPIRFDGLYWIDVIDIIAYMILFVPLLWITGAVRGLIRDRRSTAVGIIKSLIVITAGAAFVFIIMQPRLIQYWTSFLGAAWLLVCMDMLFTSKNRKGSKRNKLLAMIIVLAIVIPVVLLYPTPYMVTYPGLTVSMGRYAAAEGGSPNGFVEGVLVFERPAFPIDWIYARIFPHYSFERRENLGMTLSEYSSLVREMKADANEIGSAAALKQLGLGRGATSHGARIVAILSGSPVKGKWEAGDTIIELNNKPISSSKDLIEAMRSVRPGEQVRGVLLRDGKKLELSASTTARADAPSQAVLGIQIEDVIKLDIPRHIDYRTYLAHEGGPSHGAALALSLIDQLTEGGITYGNHVAVTGTIDTDGTIGTIGGIRQKAFTVERSGADVFFVPAGQEAEARKGARHMPIVPVNKLQDMIEWLKNNPKRQA